MDTRQYIEEGRAVLGIELGSTRIKAVLIDGEGKILAKGGFDWENHLVDGIWTYSLQEVWQGLQSCYRDLTKRVQKEYGVTLKKLSALGISAMMHGYMPFDRQGQLLTPFRTWRNNITGPAARELTELFRYNIPQRWSVAHLYQAILNGEEHVKDVDYITTLSAYVHWQLTGQRVLGVGDASGMFPIDIDRQDYRQDMLDAFDRLVAPKGYPWKLRQILPRVLTAGQPAGCLTAEGAALLDPLGNLEPGVPLCPPEGDAGTGMVATNCIRERRGNVSAGTSAFAMLVLEKELSRVYTQLDMVTTPAGKLVAMAHSQNCTSAINDWVELLGETLEAFGLKAEEGRLYETLFLKAKEGDAHGHASRQCPVQSGQLYAGPAVYLLWGHETGDGYSGKGRKGSHGSDAGPWRYLQDPRGGPGDPGGGPERAGGGHGNGGRGRRLGHCPAGRLSGPGLPVLQPGRLPGRHRLQRVSHDGDAAGAGGGQGIRGLYGAV